MAKHIEISGTEFATANEALQHADASGRGCVVLVGNKYIVTEPAEAERLAAARVPFAYVCESNGRILTVPVN